MSTLEEIAAAVDIFRAARCPFELMHCNSTYPMPAEEANLRVMQSLRARFGCRVGYSGHEVGLIVTCAAVALGATSIERHITLDRAMFGSDQAASIEIDGFCRLVRYVRTISAAMGDGQKVVTSGERQIKEKLRRVDAPALAVAGGNGH
jgi:N-acetylneuraminate synthase